MEPTTKTAPQTSLFQVYLRLRPPIPTQVPKSQSDSWLIVEPPAAPAEQQQATNPAPASTHITLQPPNDSRKRAIERFGFTKVFREGASQLDIFEETGAAESVKSLLTAGRDGLIATLGVTGSGKSHTILGSKSQRGLTQMTLDVVFRSIGQNIRRPDHPDLPTDLKLLSSLQASDSSEAQILSASSFIESTYGDGDKSRYSRAQTPMAGGGSRAQTPMMVWNPVQELPGSFPASPWSGQYSQDFYPVIHSLCRDSHDFPSPEEAVFITPTIRLLPTIPEKSSRKLERKSPSRLPFWNRLSSPEKKIAKTNFVKESLGAHHANRKHIAPPRTSALPRIPDVSSLAGEPTSNTDYVVLISMYEVYNDRIFDLLSSTNQNAPQTTTRPAAALQKGLMRRPLLFKNTELSADRKVVAGLRKIVCGSYDEAMMVLETGLTERRVAGTGSNSVSSRSHGFFCIEVKQSPSLRSYGLYGQDNWVGGTLSIVDLAGSERARNAKTTGSTLAEAGKINESLMYLGQCLQVQSDCQQDGSKPIVPFRQCKLTELLFSNSFPSSNQHSNYRTPQKAIMIVTADPQGDFNATSQILRYSALAREVTVPRIPSVTSTILAGVNHHGKIGNNERLTPYDQLVSSVELEHAEHEIARLSEECNVLSMRLAEEEIRRTEVELRLNASEERMEMLEQAVREECWAEMESRMEDERERWRAAWEEERLQGEKFVDGKIGILEKGGTFVIHEDNFAERMEDVERENDTLRARVDALEREIQSRSPTKKTKTKTITTKTEESLVLAGDANTNIATNPFLSSLRAKEKDGGSPIKKGIILTAQTTEQMIDVASISPRKLSLRSSSVSRNASSLDHESVENWERTTSTKTQRKLTTRKLDFADVSELDNY